MRYSVPVNAASEVPALVAAGASELYCGYMDEWWTRRYGDHDSASRRQGAANINTMDELRATVEVAHDLGIPLHLALNARYTEPMLDHLEELCAQFEEWGGTGVILCDLGLMWRLRTRTKLVKTLSILAVAQNAQTIRAYTRLGTTRMVLPRFMGPAEAASLLAKVPDMEAASMAFFDKCPWVDGYCRHRHGVSYLTRDAEPYDTAPPLYTFDTTYRTHACLGNVCDYLVPYPCAACQLDAFEDAGVGTAKLGGRGRPLNERLRALRFLQTARQLPDDEDRSILYRSTFRQTCHCYYGPHAQPRDSIEPLETPKSDKGRRYVGSETDYSMFFSALESLCCSNGQERLATEPITLLVPPLADHELHALINALPTIALNAAPKIRIVVNDLGTLVSLSHELKTLEQDKAVLPTLALGTLLARTDDPREVAHFLSPSQNPSRPIYDHDGHPRTLTWAPPPQTLVEHWQHPSATEPSAQKALVWLLTKE